MLTPVPGTLLAAVLPLLGPLCGECATLLAGQVTTPGYLQYLVSMISISRSASPRACSPASAGSPGLGPSSWTGRWRPTVARHMLCAVLTAGRSGEAGDGSEGVGPHRPLQRRRLRPRHEPQPRHQHPRAARRRGLRVPGVALGLNRFFSVAGLVFAFSKSG